jgi:hypothetical protein
MLAEAKSAEPTVGMGATEIMHSDRNPFTVVEVISPRKIVVQADKYTRTDDWGMSDCQRYEYERDPEGRVRTLTLRKNGRWVQVGDSGKGRSFAIGLRQKHHDFSY